MTTVEPDLERDGALGSLLLHHEVEQFLYREAELLDERRFEDWLGLFTEDIHYWMPIRTNRLRRDQGREVGAPDDVAHFDEDLLSLKSRVRRIGTGMAWAEEPASRCRRIVGNVRVAAGDHDEELSVRSNLLLYHNRGEDETNVFGAQRADVLRRSGSGALRIARRTILIDQSVILAKSFSFFF